MSAKHPTFSLFWFSPQFDVVIHPIAIITYKLFDINPSRTDEGGVEPVEVVCGEEGDPSLAAHRPVQRVQETSEGNLWVD